MFIGLKDEGRSAVAILALSDPCYRIKPKVLENGRFKRGHDGVTRLYSKGGPGLTIPMMKTLFCSIRCKLGLEGELYTRSSEYCG